MTAVFTTVATKNTDETTVNNTAATSVKFSSHIRKISFSVCKDCGHNLGKSPEQNPIELPAGRNIWSRAANIIPEFTNHKLEFCCSLVGDWYLVDITFVHFGLRTSNFSIIIALKIVSAHSLDRQM